ncbi:MAG: hypothetical protein H6715_05955 [Myxococcales bacterium]|nr:hypothetical protein [Myxococcales bacterium]MCB9708321.1 hypothetical protein [Myxococcales bacterium]
MRGLILTLAFFVLAACGGADPKPRPSYTDSSGMDLSDWDSIAGHEQAEGFAPKASNSHVIAQAKGQGTLNVRLESHCAYGYHILVKDPLGNTAYDTWIDKGRWQDLVLLPGSHFYFCGQLNECPSKPFYTVPRTKSAGPLRVFSPCSN